MTLPIRRCPYFLPRIATHGFVEEHDRLVSTAISKLKVVQLKVVLGMYKLPKDGLKKNHVELLMKKWDYLKEVIYFNPDEATKRQIAAYYFYYILCIINNYPNDYNRFIPNGATFEKCFLRSPNGDIASLFATALIMDQKASYVTFNREIFSSAAIAEAQELVSAPIRYQHAQPNNMNSGTPYSNGIYSNAHRNGSMGTSQFNSYADDTLALLNNFDYIKSPFFVKARSVKRQILPKSNIKKVEVIKFQLSNADVERLNRGNKENTAYSYELLLYCAPIKSMMSKNECISFPSPIEIKINNIQISDYIRGIKNKPETAQPARLTEHTIKDVLKDNTIQITFLRTNFQYVCNVYLVKSYNGLQLYNRAIKINEHIDKPTTIAKAQQILNEDDEELQMETMRMSLQCPISYSRMKFPVRSRYCNHIQCFDAQWYLEAQRQVPLWECPVCQDKINLTDIRICDYTTEILNNCKNDSDEQIEIRKDGSYKYLENEYGSTDDEDDEDDDSDSNNQTGKSFFKNNTSKKKSELEPEVIVLLSSEDEEEENHQSQPANSDATSHLPLPVLETAETEERVGNIVPETADEDDGEDEDEEMPSLRNDGRDLTAPLANHYILNNPAAQNINEVIGNTNSTSSEQETNTPVSNKPPANENNQAEPAEANHAGDQLRKRRASTELTRETVIDLTGDD